MKINELGKRTAPLKEGIHEVVFNHFEYVEDEKDEIIGYRIHIEGYQPIYNRFFPDSNYALDAFLDQLNEYDMRPAEINKHKGEKIIIEMAWDKTGTYLNANFRIRKARTYR